MQKYGLAAMCMAVLLLSHGCATPKRDSAMSMAQLRGSYEELLSAPENNEKGDRIISRARTMIGTPYVSGGRNPGGFDCSGLVQWAYKREGISLPRTAREQSQVGTRITDVDAMRAGDIVAFRHPRRGYHTGIYVGDGKFIHSPHRRDRVKISSLNDPYFRTTFLGARRVSADAEAALAQARSQLEDSSSERLVEYREEQAVRELRKSRQERAARRRSARAFPTVAARVPSPIAACPDAIRRKSSRRSLPVRPGGKRRRRHRPGRARRNRQSPGRRRPATSPGTTSPGKASAGQRPGRKRPGRSRRAPRGRKARNRSSASPENPARLLCAGMTPR